MKRVSSFHTALLMVPLCVGLAACEESNKEPVNKVATEPPAETTTMPPPTTPATPGSPQEMSDPSMTRNVEGEVMSVANNTYVIKDAKGQEMVVVPSPATLVDESIVAGDKAEVRFSQDNQPISIRKVRGETSAEVTTQASTP